jgi:integrase
MRHDYTLFRRKGTKVWYFYFYDHGIRKPKSTGKIKKFEAEEYARDFVIKAGRPKDNMNLKEYTQNFFVWDKCLWIKRQHSKGYNFSVDVAQQRRGHLDNYILKSFGNYKLTELNSIEIENWLIKIDKANQTKNNILGTFKIVLGEAEHEAIISRNPLENVKQLSRQSKQRDIFTDDEMELLFPIDDEDMYNLWAQQKLAVAIYVLACTGIRSGELRALQWKNVIWDDTNSGLIIDKAVKNNQTIGETKNGKPRVVILDKRANQLLNDWLKYTPFDDMEDLIFFGSGNDKAMDRSTLSKKLRKVLDKLELSTAKRTLVIHSFRHTFNTRMRRVLPLETLQELTGHQSREMSDHYDHPDFDSIYRELKNQVENYFE